MGGFRAFVTLWSFVLIGHHVTCLWHGDFFLNQVQRDVPTQGDGILMSVQKMLYNGTLSKFILYNEKLPTGGRLDPETRENLNCFIPTIDTKVIIHGYLDNLIIGEWLRVMKDEYLKRQNYNVFIVDWSIGNFIYTLAIVNARTVGEEIANFINVLKDYGANPESFHLIGHSLGAHVAGVVGENVKSIGRITGLDPAAPPFENAGPRYRLDQTDAIFVDVIHSSTKYVGMRTPVGHLDFYPNGGVSQPGCTIENTFKNLFQKGLLEGVRSVFCSHMRAPLMFIASINNCDCQMLGVKCRDWEAFQNGECGNCNVEGNCMVMGDRADVNFTKNQENKYYLIAGENRPFCLYQYHIVVEKDGAVAKLPSDSLSSSWSIENGWQQIAYKFYLFGSKGKTEYSVTERRYQNAKMLLLLPSDVNLGMIDTVIIKRNASQELAKLLPTLSVLSEPSSTLQLRRILITPLFINTRTLEDFLPVTLCSKGNSKVKGSNDTVIMKKEFC